MDGKIKYEFTTSMWQHAGPGGWHFVALPKAISKEIRTHFQWQEEGWGRMKAQAQIDAQQWNTAIWYDTKKETYLLPIKATIRQKAKLKTDTPIAMAIWV